jgi:predicted RNA-binding Zn ribbon-like protein
MDWPRVKIGVTIKITLTGKTANLKTMVRLLEKDFPPSRAGRLTQLGGVLCLNFVNTTSGRGTERLLEHLFRFEHLLAWARHAGAIDEATAKALEANPPAARVGQKVLERTVSLRDALHVIFTAVSKGGLAPAAALAEFNACLAQAMAAAAIEATPQGFAWRWNAGPMPPEGLLWPIVRSAAELLTTCDLARIKTCSGCFCGWMFLDKSRNGRRRWCEMEICGSRAKMRRYHQRQRDIAAADNPF